MATAEARDSVVDTAEAIARMEIRGAAAIAEATATALCDQATESDATDAATRRVELGATVRNRDGRGRSDGARSLCGASTGT